jgi:hypothetical protein
VKRCLFYWNEARYAALFARSPSTRLLPDRPRRARGSGPVVVVLLRGRRLGASLLSPAQVNRWTNQCNSQRDTRPAAPQEVTARRRFRLTTSRRTQAHESRSKRIHAVATRTPRLRELSRPRRFEKRSRRRTRCRERRRGDSSTHSANSPRVSSSTSPKSNTGDSPEHPPARNSRPPEARSCRPPSSSLPEARSRFRAARRTRASRRGSRRAPPRPGGARVELPQPARGTHVAVLTPNRTARLGRVELEAGYARPERDQPVGSASELAPRRFCRLFHLGISTTGWRPPPSHLRRAVEPHGRCEARRLSALHHHPVADHRGLRT